MAELTPIPSAQRPAGQVYQPVSGYVVAAAVTTTCFALFLLAVAYYAVTSRRAALTEELLLLPLLGMILAAIGRSHVRNSDGTKTGTKIATICWWVCILGGAGFVAYLLANDLAIKRQSNRFVEQEYFKELKEGRPQKAFLALVPSEERKRAMPVESTAKDAESVKAHEYFEAVYTAFGYPNFKHSEFTRLMLRNGKSVEIEHLGTKDVGQEESGLKATQLYKVRCAEGTFEVAIKSQALEGRKGGAPQWRIGGPNSIVISQPDFSQYGVLVQEIDRESDSFAKLWMAHLINNRPAIAHLLTIPHELRKDPELKFTRMMLLGGASATPMAVGPDWLPEDRAKKWQDRVAAKKSSTAFDDLQGIGFFRADDVGGEYSEDKLTKLRELWASPFILHTSQRQNAGPGGPPPDASVLEFFPDRIVARVPADLYSDGRVIFYRAHIVVECTQPEVLAAVNAARERGLAGKNDGSVSLRNLPVRDWRIVALVTDVTAQSPPPPKQGGPGGPGGGRPGG